MQGRPSTSGQRPSTTPEVVGSFPRHGLGLRVQIVLALSVAFIASFALLGIAAVQLTQRARAADRTRDAQATARAIAAVVDAGGPDAEARLEAMADAVVGSGGVRRVEIVRDGLTPWVRGVPGPARRVDAPLAGGGHVRLWVATLDPASSAPLANLLLLYVAVTGGAILILAYVALTYLIVRPVEGLTRASERIAGGSKLVTVPVKGAAEVARLAVAFNAMTSELRTERVSLEERLRELERTTRDLRTAQRQVARSAHLASVGRLAAGVAHEIGNPLAAILGLLDLVRDANLTEAERAEMLRRIGSETERIHHIIRDLLDFSRQGSDADEQEGSADLGVVVEDAVRLIAPQKDLGRVRIERRLAAEVPPVRGSADRLTQVVLNLLLNAADAISGEGAIRIEVNATDDPEEVVLVVADSGPGVAAEVIDHLFEPFVTTKPAGHGTGLGLAVCYTLIEQLGGSIMVSNPREGGARFEVRLPVVRSPE